MNSLGTGRLLAATLVAAGAMSSEGCILFTASLRDAGKRSEHLRCSGAERGPFSRGYTDARRSRFSLCYRTNQGERWLNFRGPELLRWAEREAGKPDASRREVDREQFGAEEGLVLSERATQRYLSARPRWRRCDQLLDFCPVTGRSGPGGDAAVGVQFPCHEKGLPEGERVADDRARGAGFARAWVRIEAAEGSPGRWVALSVGPRHYRTACGKAAQALLPLAVAADVATCPLQGLMVLMVLNAVH